MTQFPAIADEAHPLEIDACDIVRSAHAHGGYSVQILVAPPSSDDLWETLNLPVIFPSRAQAEAMVAVVKARGEIDLRFWTWTPSWASAWSFMKKSPIAQRREVPLRDVASFAD